MTWKILQGDCRELLATLPDASVQTCVTSPPYWGLRDYGVAEQLGLEATPEEYVDVMVAVFAEVRRVLRDDGTLWLNLGDSYITKPHGAGSTHDPKHAGARRRGVDNRANRRPIAGLKHKDLVGVPWRVALALQADGWWLRSDIIWAKPNPMPDPVTDRPTKAHEYVFLLAKSEKYFYDANAVREASIETAAGNTQRQYRGDHGGVEHDRSRSHQGFSIPWTGTTRNRRTVWTVTPQPFAEAHFATFPPKLIEPCVLAGAPIGGVVLDPFNGAGTTGLVATRLQRDYIGIELNPEYVEMSRKRIEGDAPLFNLASGE